MDPISQGTLGASLPVALMSRDRMLMLGVIGFIAGIAPDLDIFITSSRDPLLFLEYHRGFTHALAFIPIGAAFVALTCYLFVRNKLPFKVVYLASFLGYASHGFLDACTTYGTQLFWPFSDARVAWDVISVVDPAFTLPLLICLLISIYRRSFIPIRIGLVIAVCYLLLGLLQHTRAINVAEQLAHNRGHHEVHDVVAKPSMANLLVWKTIYLRDGRYYIDTVRTGIGLETCGGVTADRLNIDSHLPWLDLTSQQALDVQRFSWFSMGYVSVDPSDPYILHDVRYSFRPDRAGGLWGIRLDPEKSNDEHVEYFTNREVSGEDANEFTRLLSGDRCNPALP